MDNDNVVQFKGIFRETRNASFVAEKLKEFVDTHPDVEMLIAVRSKKDNFITAGWSASESGDLLLLAEFARLQVISNVFEPEE